jgi:hypothetical protein
MIEGSILMSCDSVIRGGLVGVALILHAASATAQDDRRQAPASLATPAPPAPETLKERLSDKASDERRVDNCKVPVDRRGPMIRPEGCRPDDASAALSKPPR